MKNSLTLITNRWNLKKLVHKVASMLDTPNFVPKFSFNPVKMNYLGYQTQSCSWCSVNITIVAIFRFFLVYRQLSKVFAHFYHFFTCLFNEIACKTLALADTFKYTPKGPDFTAWLYVRVNEAVTLYFFFQTIQIIKKIHITKHFLYYLWFN